MTRDVLVPLALWFLVTVLYASLTFGCHLIPNQSQVSQSCYFNQTTFDNVLPKIFADDIFNGHPRALIGDWQGSDRPPLQSGVTLLESPLSESPSGIFDYQIVAIFLQTMWVPVLWVMAKRLGLNGGQRAVVFLLFLSSGFLFFNSIFTWPKLLAGSLGALSLCWIFFEKPRLIYWMTAGAAASLAMLAHTGVAFTFVPVIAVLCTKRFFPGWKPIGVGLISALILFVPWTAYQHFYDPPGNRLLKWQVGGVIQKTDQSFGSTVVESYKHAGLADSFENKYKNAYTLIYAREGTNHIYNRGLLGTLRDMEFRFVFFGMGLLNLGWIGLVFPQIRRRLRRSNINLKHLKVTLGLAAASIAIWVVVLFGPNATIIHQGSYLTMLLLMMTFSTFITIFPKLLVRAIIGLRLISVILLWVVSVYAHRFVSWEYIIFSSLAAAAIAWLLYTISNNNPADEK